MKKKNHLKNSTTTTTTLLLRIVLEKFSSSSSCQRFPPCRLFQASSSRCLWSGQLIAQWKDSAWSSSTVAAVTCRLMTFSSDLAPRSNRWPERWLMCHYVQLELQKDLRLRWSPRSFLQTPQKKKGLTQEHLSILGSVHSRCTWTMSSVWWTCPVCTVDVNGRSTMLPFVTPVGDQHQALLTKVSPKSTNIRSSRWLEVLSDTSRQTHQTCGCLTHSVQLY